MLSLHEVDQSISDLGARVRGDFVVVVLGAPGDGKYVLNASHGPGSIPLNSREIGYSFIDLGPVSFHIGLFSVIAFIHGRGRSPRNTLEQKNIVQPPSVILRLHYEHFGLDKLGEKSNRETLFLSWVFPDTFMDRHHSFFIS